MALRRLGFILAAVLVVGFLAFNNYSNNTSPAIKKTPIDSHEDNVDVPDHDKAAKEGKKSKKKAKKVEEVKEEPKPKKDTQDSKKEVKGKKEKKEKKSVEKESEPKKAAKK